MIGGGVLKNRSKIGMKSVWPETGVQGPSLEGGVCQWTAVLSVLPLFLESLGLLTSSATREGLGAEFDELLNNFLIFHNDPFVTGGPGGRPLSGRYQLRCFLANDRFERMGGEGME